MAGETLSGRAAADAIARLADRNPAQANIIQSVGNYILALPGVVGLRDSNKTYDLAFVSSVNFAMFIAPSYSEWANKRNKMDGALTIQLKCERSMFPELRTDRGSFNDRKPEPRAILWIFSDGKIPRAKEIVREVAALHGQ